MYIICLILSKKWSDVKKVYNYINQPKTANPDIGEGGIREFLDFLSQRGSLLIMLEFWPYFTESDLTTVFTLCQRHLCTVLQRCLLKLAF